MSDNEGRTNLRMPDEEEVFAVVTEMTGAEARGTLGALREDIAGQPFHRARGSAD